MFTLPFGVTAHVTVRDSLIMKEMLLHPFLASVYCKIYETAVRCI